MKKTFSRSSPLSLRAIPKLISFLFLLNPLICAISAKAQNGDPAKGKELFQASCAGCHGISEVKVGPALGIPNPELEKLGVAYVLNWVHNPKALIDKGDPYAKKIYSKYNEILMPAFPDITPDQLHDIKVYIDEAYKNAPQAPVVTSSQQPVASINELNSNVPRTPVNFNDPYFIPFLC